MKIKLKISSIIYPLLLAGLACFIYWSNITLKEKKASMLPVIGAEQAHTVGQFSFLNQDGKTITNDDVKGKICIVSYFFATCKGICPKMNANMSLVYHAFSGNKNVVILSHTVDPEEDNVQALKRYSMHFGADPNQWMFLTGEKKKLYDMARYSYLISAGDDTTGVGIDEDFIHDQQFTLVDGFGRLRGFYDGLDSTKISQLITDVRRLLKEMQ